MNNINSINKKEKDQKEITVILGKVAGEGFSYLDDSLHECSKIKIPLIYDQQSDFKNSLNGDYSNLKEKSISESQKYSSSITNTNIQKDFEDSKIEMPKNEHFNNDSEMMGFKAFGNEDKNSALVPSCTQWFKLDDIHDIEVKANPEFFSGRFPSKTAEVYKEYRNYIISLFRENPNSYLSSTTCRRHLAGDACSILRIHTFLEHWGIINFNVDPSNKPTNPILPKSYNYRNPVYVDASSFIVKETTPNFGSKIGDNAIVLTNKTGEEIKTLYPINNNPENLFRSIFNKNTLNSTNKMNFIAKNYRLKCDMCNKLCGIEWYLLNKDNHEIKNLFIVCENCFENNNIPKDLKKEDFEISNIYSILEPNEQYEKNLKEKFENENWSLNDTLELIDNYEKYGENWDEIIKNLNQKRTKNECILHIMQLPIKENVVFKFSDVKLSKQANNSSLLDHRSSETSESTKLLSSIKDCNALSDQSNPIIQQIVFFAKMFENFANNDLKKTKEEIEAEFHTKINPNNSYQDFILNSLNEKREILNIETLKDLIYRTYSKAKENTKISKNEEKKKMKKIMSLIIYLQMRKIEMKLNYFNEFERLIQNEGQQLKSMESQIIQDRIKLALKKSEINQLARKFKDIINPANNNNNSNKNFNLSSSSIVNNFEKSLDLNEETKKDNNLNYLDNKEFNIKNNKSINPNSAGKASALSKQMEIQTENTIKKSDFNEINIDKENNKKNEIDKIEEEKNKENNNNYQNEKDDIEMKNIEQVNDNEQSKKNTEKSENINKDEENNEIEEEGEFEEVDEEEIEEELEELEENQEELSEEAKNPESNKNSNVADYNRDDIKVDNEAVVESENVENNNNIDTLNYDKAEEGISENDDNSNNNDNEKRDEDI